MQYIIIQAGGKGTRLGYLTANKPKALVPVDNLPMIFHLFRKYPHKRFIIIADYKKEVLREYLSVFSDVAYQIVEASQPGTCAGIQKAVQLLPAQQPFMLIWSDLLLPAQFDLPEEYQDENTPENDYIGLSQTFPCRWKYENGIFAEEPSKTYGVAGLFLFTDREKLQTVPESGELVRWMQKEQKTYKELSLAGTREFGLLEEYKKLTQAKCRPFNQITVEGDILTKTPIDEQGKKLAIYECEWYEKAKDLGIPILPKIYNTSPLQMEYIKGKNIYDGTYSREEKEAILEMLVDALKKLHSTKTIPTDIFSLKEAYYHKTMKRLSRIEDLVPFAREKEITVNGKRCRNIYFHKRALESELERLQCSHFSFIHGDCTFSNLMVREDGTPVLLDPRGYFGYTRLFGDELYDWAKLYYSVVGNYDPFNLGKFRLEIGGGYGAADSKIPYGEVSLQIESNGWEDMEQSFFELTQTDPHEIKLLHAVIWLSLTTYAWQDYDAICGAFYNGLYYLEDVL